MSLSTHPFTLKVEQKNLNLPEEVNGKEFVKRKEKYSDFFTTQTFAIMKMNVNLFQNPVRNI